MNRQTVRVGSCSSAAAKTAHGLALGCVVLWASLVIPQAIARGQSAGADKATAATPTTGDDVVLRAIVDELDRSMKDLEFKELDRPYFIQFRARERHVWSMAAQQGSLIRSDERRTRDFTSRVRVGNMELDNTNFGRASGRAAPLPIDDNYLALRQAIWLTVDGDYKQAVETLTAKNAYLKETNVEDRPADFSPAPVESQLHPPESLEFDASTWERRLAVVSARFKNYPRIQDSSVNLIAADSLEWTINTEGARVRTGDTGLILVLSADLQASDGMRLGDRRSFLGLTASDLPGESELLNAADELCRSLEALADAPTLDHYAGPVLFDGEAAGQMFGSMLGARFCARPDILGAGGGSEESFEKKLGLRILPRSFSVHDDPRPERFNGQLLAGAYEFDDEGVPATRVSLVEKGILKTLLAGRAPTRKIVGSTGHARTEGFGDPRATPGCLYIQDAAGVSAEELRKELILAAKDEGLPFALRVTSLQRGGPGGLGNPIYAYKVDVETGREELVRGLNFLRVETRSLKRVLAAGNEPTVYNDLGGVAFSVIAPAVVFEELELTRPQQEFEKLPILASPGRRESAGG